MKEVLIIDLSNIWIKYYHVNKDNINFVDGALHGCCNLLTLIYRNINKYKNIYIVLDSNKKDNEKTNLYEEYKNNRTDKKDIFKNLNYFLYLISILPKIKIVKNNYAEADEIIAYLSLNLCDKNKIIIFSNDKDFLQLSALSENIHISNNFKNGEFIVLSNKEILDKIKDNKKQTLPKNLNEIIKWKIFLGDVSDNVKVGIKKLRKEKIREIISVWHEDYLDDNVLADIIMRLSDIDLKMKIAENFNNILTNYKLMSLRECKNNYTLKKETKYVNIDINKDKYLKILEKFKLSSFKLFVNHNKYI